MGCGLQTRMTYAETHTSIRDPGIRDPGLDTAKTVLIWLVVFGHLMEPYIKGDEVLRAAYIFIYAFHVPALVFVSGMCSRAELSWHAMGKLLAHIAQPLVICQVLFWSVEVLVLGNTLDWYAALTQPFWLLWYLASLVCWRLLMIPLSHFRFALSASILIALLAGWFDSIGYTGSFSRTLVLLPFFIAGYQTGSLGRLPLRHLPKAGMIAFVVLVMSAFMAVLLAHNGFKPHHLYFAKSYHAVKLDDGIGMVVRGILLGWAFSMAWAFLVLLPKNENRLSLAGRHSLLPYLSHGFVVHLATGLGVFDFLRSHLSPIEILVFSLFASVAMVWLFASKPMLWLQSKIYTPVPWISGQMKSNETAQPNHIPKFASR